MTCVRPSSDSKLGEVRGLNFLPGSQWQVLMSELWALKHLEACCKPARWAASQCLSHWMGTWQSSHVKSWEVLLQDHTLRTAGPKSKSEYWHMLLGLFR